MRCPYAYKCTLKDCGSDICLRYIDMQNNFYGRYGIRAYEFEHKPREIKLNEREVKQILEKKT